MKWLIIIGVLFYFLFMNFEITEKKFIHEALYCIEYGNKLKQQSKYIDSNCYINNCNVNDKVNSYYKKEIF